MDAYTLSSLIMLGLFIFFSAIILVFIIRCWVALKLIIRACKKYLGEE